MSKGFSFTLNEGLLERYGLIADLHRGRFFPGRIIWNQAGIITLVEEFLDVSQFGDAIDFSKFITPPLVNAHVHIESSMLVPSRFGPPCLACGVGATVSDPHEIANVLGVAGIDFMIENARLTPLRIHFGAPSCVPATNSTFETSGAELNAEAVEKLLQSADIHYLAEVMNFPGVLADDAQLLAKIAAAVKVGKRVDGHAPGLRADAARSYAAHGITTDHECFTLAEALEKISFGMKILIREGSAAKNFEALYSIISTHPQNAMLCSDDLHPDEIITGNIDSLCRRALAKGCSLIDVLRAASFNPVKHYGLNLGLLQVGDKADFVCWDNQNLNKVTETVLAGETVWRFGADFVGVGSESKPNLFHASPIAKQALKIPASRLNDPVIEVIDQQIITRSKNIQLKIKDGELLPDIESDVVKLVVVNRYDLNATPAVCFVTGTGIQKGAISSSVAHDSHNIIACGADDESIVAVINATIAARGAVGCAVNQRCELLELPVAGLMSDKPAQEVGARYGELTQMVKNECGSKLTAPFMTLSFLSLLVIPELKLSDKGLFDAQKFEFVTI